MTSYKDWVADYPKLALELLRRAYPDAEANELEVTLLLSVGSLLLSAPYERLKYRKDKSNEQIMHVAHDRFMEENEELVRKFDNLLNEGFRSSTTLFKGKSDYQWQGGVLSPACHKPMDPSSWDQEGRRFDHPDAWKLPNDWKVGHVFKVMRNAVSHGQVITYSRSRTTGKIGKLIFLNECGELISRLPKKELIRRREEAIPLQQTYEFVSASPPAWRFMLERWAIFLRSVKPMLSAAEPAA